MKFNLAKFEAPGLDENAKSLYTRLYGEAGTQFMDILSSSPNEIAIISRLIAYLEDKEGVK